LFSFLLYQPNCNAMLGRYLESKASFRRLYGFKNQINLKKAQWAMSQRLNWEEQFLQMDLSYKARSDDVIIKLFI